MFNINSKKITRRALVCAVAVLFTASAAFAAVVPPDVADSQHADAIAALVEADVITGSTDGLFHPFDNLTRAQACIIIVKAIDPPNAEIAGTPTQKVPGSGFSDMIGYGWAEGYVSYAVRNGIVNGYPDGTFRPGSDVTCSEMLTMVLRAAGFKDSDIGANWPADFIAKAAAEGVTAGLPEELPNLATKEIAARMAYNKLDSLRAAGVPEEEETGDTAAGDDTPWGAENLTFATGKFDGNMTMYAGIPISSKAAVYTYGVKADYKKDMKLPPKEGDYRKDTVHKYKLAETPCFYIKTGNEITLLILPMDAGFSGRIYCVINSSSNIVNGKGDQVYNVYTLAAAQPVSWLTKDTGINIPGSADYLNGEIFELTAKDGVITKDPQKASDPGSNKKFREFTGGSWEKVKSFDNNVITMDTNELFEMADNAVVYVLNSDGKSYKIGKMADVKKDAEIRMFSIDEDEGDVVTHITVNKK